MPLADAKKHVKSIRGCINPNDGFMSQLHSYEGILTARFARLIHLSSMACIQWNLRIIDPLGTSILSIVQRLPLIRR